MRLLDGSRRGDEPPIAYRRMRHADLPRVMEIERAAFVHPWSDALLARELSHDWSTVLLATAPRPRPAGGEAEAILGFVVFWLVHDELHVLNVAVAPEERKRGVARALMRQAEERARQGGARLATLEVRRSNAAAIALYLSMGYRQVGIRPNYYAEEGEDAIVMECEL
jgi:[ribosomal protein S18]-alanine N-acetyltransferase